MGYIHILLPLEASHRRWTRMIFQSYSDGFEKLSMDSRGRILRIVDSFVIHFLIRVSGRMIRDTSRFCWYIVKQPAFGPRQMNEPPS